MKTCNQCNKGKDISEYYKEKRGAQGVKSKCKECIDRSKKAYEQNHRSEIKIREAAYRERKQDEVQITKRKYYQKHQDKYVSYAREYRKTNKELIKQRYADNSQSRISRNLRKRIFVAVRKESKNTSSMQLTGCSRQHLIEHLQSMFRPGMSWQNYGKNGWHVDHRLPCKMFDLTKECEQRLCFNWSNLQPLWSHENLEKGGKFDVDEDTLTSIYLLFE